MTPHDSETAILEAFSPPVRAWFQQSFGQPTPAQALGGPKGMKHWRSLWLMAVAASIMWGPACLPEERLASTPSSSSPLPPNALATPSPTAIPPASRAGAEAHLASLKLRLPLAGVNLPQEPGLLPGAPRAYRNGVHEGIDFYYLADGSPVPRGAPVLAAASGTVTRADWDYREMAAAEMAQLLAATERLGITPPEALDRLRGRQVWIDHGRGLVTRYAHLEGIAAGIQPGKRVEQGEVIAYVGNSGTPEAAAGGAGEVHLHLEVRLADSYLGQGLAPGAIQALLKQAFASPGR